MTPDEVARLVAAGFFDPAAPDAEAQKAILDRLVELGLSVDEMLEAQRLGNLVLRAYERMIRPGERLTMSELAAQLGEPEEIVLRCWRAFGFPDPAPDERHFTAADVALMEHVRGMANAVGIDLALHAARAT